MSAAESQSVTPSPRRESGLRYIVESLVSLALAVVLVRSFLVEGYIISTGSMAPYLLGYHKQVVCPDCRLPFAVGVPVEEGTETNGPVACPNCGQAHIDLSAVPRNEGDQLLVQKFAYLLRHPKRWEVVVFQNPNRPTQAYVKRVIGLPGEEIQVRAGDVWINGELARKNLVEQRSTRMIVSSPKYQSPNSDEFRWQTESGWTVSRRGFEFKSESIAPGTDDATSPRSVTYRGTAPQSSASLSLADATQLWPTDEYAYNGLTELMQKYRVRDLMLVMQVELHSGRGEMTWTLSDGVQTFEVSLAAGERELRLLVDGVEEPDQRVKLSGSMWKRMRLVEMSLFDRQLLFALDGEVIYQRVLEPLVVRAKNSASDDVSPVRFGARNLHVTVSDLTLYRDVYYTRGDARHGVNEPYALRSDEYFFLGDNSPVSLDSRSWMDAIVRDPMLIGKPFLVHLPSRPGRVKLGSAEWHIRVPDWERIRYIR
ncbi:MAG: signal peptidase I [Planctomycetaceae bacterium]